MSAATEIKALSESTGVSVETIEYMAQRVVSLMERDGVTERDMDEAGSDLSAAYLMSAVKQDREMAIRATMNERKFAENVLALLKS